MINGPVNNRIPAWLLVMLLFCTMVSGALSSVEKFEGLYPKQLRKSDSANPHYVRSATTPLWDHRSTGQLSTLIPRGHLEYCEVSRLRQVMLV